MPGRLIAALLFILVGFAALVALLVAAWRRTLAELESSGLAYRMRCEKCGAEFSLAPREFARPGMRRVRSTSKTRAKGVALVDQPHYGFAAKRFVCPTCGERAWCENLNANEARKAIAPIALRNFGAALLILVVVGSVLSAVLL